METDKTIDAPADFQARGIKIVAHSGLKPATSGLQIFPFPELVRSICRVILVYF